MSRRIHPPGNGKTAAPRTRSEIAARAPPPPRTNLAVKPAASKSVAPKPAAVPPAKASRIPLIGLTLIAAAGLAIAIAALVFHFRTGGGQIEYSEEVLSKDLVAVEPETSGGDLADSAPADAGEDALPDVATPALMATAGDPIVVKRQQSVPRQILKVEGAAAKAATSLKLPGEVFRLTDTLSGPAGGLSTGVPGSQLSFAFTQTEGDSEDDSGAATPQDPQTQDATVITVGGGDDVMEAGPSRFTFMQAVDAETPLADLLTGAGFDGEAAKKVAAAFKDQFGLEKLAKADAVAAAGFRPDASSTPYIPVQVAIYRGGEALGSLAFTEYETYEKGENPWLGQDIFQDTEEAAPVAKLRLLDVIYNTAMRNKLSTTVAGEIIQLLSRNHDLEQSANGDETMLVLFGTKARDQKSGLGRVLYVRIDRGSDDPLECFSFQPAPRSPFECVSGSGEGAVGGGMVSPLPKGIIMAKFGPIRDPVTKKRRMNYGVDWVAPPGSPVVAAYAGQVIFAGVDDKTGTTVKLAHDGGQVTVYANLNTIANGMAEGRSVRPGQRLGTVGLTAGQSEARLHFELLRNGQPVDPFGAYQAQVEKGGAVETMVYRITTIESGNNCHARNPLSTAVGLGQFIKTTWMTTIRTYRPDLVAGRSVGEVLALREDCAIALEMTTAFTRANASTLRASGQLVTPGNLYLAHFLGVGGAIKALASNPQTQIADAFGASHVQANPFESGKTLGWLIEWAARKMAGKGKAPIVASSPAQAKAKSFASNSNFVKFKEAVTAMLN